MNGTIGINIEKRFRKRDFLLNYSDEKGNVNRSHTKEKAVNPLLILLLICVVLTWGIAATLIFNLVDYRGIVDRTTRIEIKEDDVKVAIGALYPFQYEPFRHPIRFVGKCLIHIDDYLSHLFTPRKDPYIPVDRRRQLPQVEIIPYKKKRIEWANHIVQKEPPKAFVRGVPITDKLSFAQALGKVNSNIQKVKKNFSKKNKKIKKKKSQKNVVFEDLSNQDINVDHNVENIEAIDQDKAEESILSQTNVGTEFESVVDNTPETEIEDETHESHLEAGIESSGLFDRVDLTEDTDMDSILNTNDRLDSILDTEDKKYSKLDRVTLNLNVVNQKSDEMFKLNSVPRPTTLYSVMNPPNRINGQDFKFNYVPPTLSLQPLNYVSKMFPEALIQVPALPIIDDNDKQSSDGIFEEFGNNIPSLSTILSDEESNSFDLSFDDSKGNEKLSSDQELTTKAQPEVENKSKESEEQTESSEEAENETEDTAAQSKNTVDLMIELENLIKSYEASWNSKFSEHKNLTMSIINDVQSKIGKIFKITEILKEKTEQCESQPSDKQKPDSNEQLRRKLKKVTRPSVQLTAMNPIKSSGKLIYKFRNLADRTVVNLALSSRKPILGRFSKINRQTISNQKINLISRDLALSLLSRNRQTISNILLNRLDQHRGKCSKLNYLALWLNPQNKNSSFQAEENRIGRDPARNSVPLFWIDYINRIYLKANSKSTIQLTPVNKRKIVLEKFNGPRTVHAIIQNKKSRKASRQEEHKGLPTLGKRKKEEIGTLKEPVRPANEATTTRPLERIIKNNIECENNQYKIIKLNRPTIPMPITGGDLSKINKNEFKKNNRPTILTPPNDQSQRIKTQEMISLNCIYSLCFLKVVICVYVIA